MTLAEMQFLIPDLRAASGEIFVLTMACLILVFDLLVKEKKRTLTFAATQATLVGLVLISFVSLATSSGDVNYTFSHMYVADVMSDLLKFLLAATVLVVLLYSRRYVLQREQMARGEYYVLALFATLGMMVMISANHLLIIYVGLELLSLSLYAMVAFNRDATSATEAAMKYFVLGALASGLLLYGMSMVYGATGTLEITTIAERLYMGQVDRVVMVFGLVFLISGIAFKLGVVPFHMWIPDVYHGAPTAVTLFIATAPKLAAFGIIFRILVNGLIVFAQDWQSMLMILAVLSMAVGNVAAIAQTNLKRMLAYSAISHMGFMLLGMVTGVIQGDARFALDAYSSSMFYVITYVLTSLGTFGMILLMAGEGLECDELEDFKGLNRRSPWFAAMMMMMMFSMAGIPFFVGFFAKFAVLQAVVAAGYFWLAIVAVLFSVIGCFYYLRVVKIMYFDQPDNNLPIAAPFNMRLVISMNGLAVALLGIFPGSLMSVCHVAVLHSL